MKRTLSMLTFLLAISANAGKCNARAENAAPPEPGAATSESARSIVPAPVKKHSAKDSAKDNSQSATPASAHKDKPKRAPVFPSDIRMERNVAYLPEGRKELADLYFPAQMPAGKKLPALVWIHGGGWVGGTRDSGREISVCSELARNGYVMMSIDYTLADKERPVWPKNLWDCKTAVRWLRKNADRLGVDPERIGVAGGSAGGHLALMVAMTTPSDGLDPTEPYADTSCAVKCAIDMYGITDIAAWHDTPMLGKTNAEAPELYRAASPVTYARKITVPVLICHGTADALVNVRQAELLDAALKRAGAEYQCEIIPGAVHTFDLNPKQRDLRPLVLKFLGQHLH